MGANREQTTVLFVQERICWDMIIYVPKIDRQLSLLKDDFGETVFK